MQLTNNIITELQDYMFTSNNLDIFSKHIIQINIQPKSSLKNIDYNNCRYNDYKYNDNNCNYVGTKLMNPNSDIKDNKKEKVNSSIENVKLCNDTITNKITINNNKQIASHEKKYEKETMYKPKQKDSLFWCFYILKHGYSNYEMEIGNQHFTIEKTEKFKYIDQLRKNKEILKIHKIKPFTELEDDLANKDKISVKTFFALCILENINVLLVDKRKIFELTCIDIDKSHPVNVIHRNRKNYEHHIELNVTDEILKKYRETYYNGNILESSLKSVSSYKLDELVDLCKRLEIDICKQDKKKMTKKDIYELLVLNY